MEENKDSKLCASCGLDIVAIKDSVVFKCPNCSNTLSRCGKCRIKGVKYTCPVCGFTGP